MPISTSCGCGRKLNLKDELAGKTVKCPQCGTALKVPGGSATATAVATPPVRPSLEKAPSKPPKETKAGPKVLMGNFKSLEDFDEKGEVKKKKKVFDKEEMTSSEVGTSGGEMAKIAAEAMKAEEHRPKERCPTCGRGVKPDDVICTKCGTNIKTGKRLGESSFSFSKNTILVTVGVLLISAAGAVYHFTKIPKKTQGEIIQGKLDGEKEERAAVLAYLDSEIAEEDAPLEMALVAASYLGCDALPHLSAMAKDGTAGQKRKAVLVMEVLSFNGYHSQEAVDALATLSRDPDRRLRGAAVETLFWTAIDATKATGYWDAWEEDPQKRTDVSEKYKLPFSDNCEKLLAAGVKMRMLEADPTKLKEYGVRPFTSPNIPEASKVLADFWQVEADQRNKLTVLIQAVRSGQKHLVEELIKYLGPPEQTKLPFVPSQGDIARAWRCLHQVTGRPSKRYEQWVSWWTSSGKQQFPKPVDKPKPAPPSEDGH